MSSITLEFDTVMEARRAFEATLPAARRAYHSRGREQIETASGDSIFYRVKTVQMSPGKVSCTSCEMEERKSG